MTTTLTEFTRWLVIPSESQSLEFKEASVQFDNIKLFRTCVALANEGGGKLILGVSDGLPRRVTGTTAFNNPSGIQSRILDKLRFHVEVEEFQHPEGRIVIFHVPSRPRGTAYHLDGAYFMRSPDGTVAMSEDRLREIFDEGKPAWLMGVAREGCSAAEVVQLLDTRTYFDLTKQPIPTTRDGEIRRFESESLVTEDHSGYSITNLGAVLFAKRLEDFDGLFRKGPRVIVYDGPDKTEQSRVFQPGTKGYAVGFAGLIDFINAQNPIK